SGAGLDQLAGLARWAVDPGWAARSRDEQRAEPDADIGMPLASVPVRRPQYQMAGRPRLAGSTAHADARQHWLDLEAHMLKRRRQEQVVLEAIPAPPAGDELSLQIGLLQRDRDAAVGVEVLERDRRRVCPVDRLPGRLIRRVQADPAEVRVGIEHQANGTDLPSVLISAAATVAAEGWRMADLRSGRRRLRVRPG